ncbi:MAG: AraC family transcriptional regulator [Muribaculaceae bacterium]|nr:AraC family transcriptional regulator [Muribaculaceae bacterium]
MSDPREHIAGFTPARVEALRKYATFFSSSGADYHVGRIDLTPGFMEELKDSGPVSLQGMTVMLITRGVLEIELNTTVRTLPQNTLLVTDSRTLQTLRKVGSPKVTIYILSLSPEFLRGISIDINVLHNAHFRSSSEPLILSDLHEPNLLVGYMNMLNENAVHNSSNIYSKNISRSLIAAMIYQMMHIADRAYVADVSNKVTSKSDGNNAARRMNYVKEFMRLIHENYARERSLNFYADKMCISPKYLSTIIKESTSRSAAEWIDEYVMLEAKNMLRFSGMNIQQVAYALNFRNQSAFGKYFKHLAGMSPSQFQKS